MSNEKTMEEVTQMLTMTTDADETEIDIVDHEQMSHEHHKDQEHPEDVHRSQEDYTSSEEEEEETNDEDHSEESSYEDESGQTFYPPPTASPAPVQRENIRPKTDNAKRPGSQYDVWRTRASKLNRPDSRAVSAHHAERIHPNPSSSSRESDRDYESSANRIDRKMSHEKSVRLSSSGEYIDPPIPMQSTSPISVASHPDALETLTDILKDPWPEKPIGYMENIAKDMDSIIETIEELFHRCYGYRVPISTIMKITSNQSNMFVSNIISKEMDFEISTKTAYLQIHSFAAILRHYREQGKRVDAGETLPSQLNVIPSSRPNYPVHEATSSQVEMAPVISRDIVKQNGKRLRVELVTDTDVTDTESQMEPTNSKTRHFAKNGVRAREIDITRESRDRERNARRFDRRDMNDPRQEQKATQGANRRMTNSNDSNVAPISAQSERQPQGGRFNGHPPMRGHPNGRLTTGPKSREEWGQPPKDSDGCIVQ